jgi:phosphoglycolate phosphatase-like HAD superfamily hydrolase
MHNPDILALDFDGVICDGLIEYFETAWRTYCQIWSTGKETPPENLAPLFYRLRPVIEVGWEMPVLIRALLLGISEERIWADWNAVARAIIADEGLQAAYIGAKLDGLRDDWIATDLEGWLSLHRFYPGVLEKLRSLVNTATQPYIITTKEGRFTKQLLAQQNIKIPADFIFGKECKRPKYEILRELIAESEDTRIKIWFVEDRLKTLQSVAKQPDLERVRLYLADWGYNTLTQHESIRNNSRIELLSLSEFAADFSHWP